MIAYVLMQSSSSRRASRGVCADPQAVRGAVVFHLGRVKDGARGPGVIFFVP